MAIAKRKKRFFTIEIPLIKKDVELQAYEMHELNGRIISYDLTRLLRGKNLLAQFVVSAGEKEAVANPREIKVMPSFLRRMIRKGTNQIDDSFTAKTSDGEAVVKPFLITRRKVPRKIRTALRIKAREEIMNYAKEKTSAQLFDDTLKNILQKELSLRLKKIYPVSFCEIRILKLKSK